MEQLVFNYLISIIRGSLAPVIPATVISLITWDVTLLLNTVTPFNYKAKVLQSVSETLHQQICDTFLRNPIIVEQPLPQNTCPYDLLLKYIRTKPNPEKVEFLASIYHSFMIYGSQCPHLPLILSLSESLGSNSF
jgi:hypothetical protein